MYTYVTKYCKGVITIKTSWWQAQGGDLEWLAKFHFLTWVVTRCWPYWLNSFIKLTSVPCSFPRLFYFTFLRKVKTKKGTCSGIHVAELGPEPRLPGSPSGLHSPLFPYFVGYLLTHCPARSPQSVVCWKKKCRFTAHFGWLSGPSWDNLGGEWCEEWRCLSHFISYVVGFARLGGALTIIFSG